MMLWIRSLIFDIWLWVWMAILGILGAPLALWSKGGAYWVMELYSRNTLWMLKHLCGLDYEIRGTPPAAQSIVAAKHQSFIDNVLMLLQLPRMKMVMKAELKWAPVFGWYAMRIGAAPVARGKGQRAVADMTARLASERGEGGSLAIYPQGTRVSPDGPVSRYKSGVWRLYKEFDLPCVPVAMNTGVFWGRRTLLRYPGTMVVEFLEPIPTGMAQEPFMALLEERIEAASNRLRDEARAKGAFFKS